MAPESNSNRKASPCTIYHGAGIRPSSFGASPEEAERWRSASELFARQGGDEGAVLIADGSSVGEFGAVRNLPAHVVIIAGDFAAETSLGYRAQFSVAEFRDATSRRRVLAAACHLSCARLTSMRRRRQVARINRELRDLSHLGLALMEERDLDTLLHKLLSLGTELTESDGGGVFLAEKRPDDPDTVLRLAMFEIGSLPGLATFDVTLAPDETSIVGHAAQEQTAAGDRRRVRAAGRLHVPVER